MRMKKKLVLKIVQALIFDARPFLQNNKGVGKKNSLGKKGKTPTAQSKMADQVIRLKPFQYIHVLDNNTNVTSVLAYVFAVFVYGAAAE